MVLKLVSAKMACKLPLRVQASVLELMVSSNANFNAMIEGFPKRRVKLISPNHVGLGIMDITGDGLTSMSKDDIGNDKM